MSNKASIDVINERVRQLEGEEWDYTHDDQYTHRELCRAAIAYANDDGLTDPTDWPWGKDDWKPKSYRENLVRAAALLIAEIERIDRLSNTEDN